MPDTHDTGKERWNTVAATSSISALDSIVRGELWRAFLEGMEIPYYKVDKPLENIQTVIEREQIRPQRVAALLGMPEERATL